MQTFDSDGVEIAYEVAGEGPPILLAHGFAAGYVTNWLATGWFEALSGRGRQVIGFDCRGHGQSGKPHELARYANGEMQRDVLRLLDHLKLERADMMGYSMGAWLLLPLLANHPDRIHSAVLGGAGAPLPETTTLHAAITAVFEGKEPAASIGAEERESAQLFRNFAAAMGNDLVALSCVLRSGVLRGDALRAVGKCPTPVLLVAGDLDNLAGDPAALAAEIPGSRLVLVPEADHLSTVGSPIFRDAVLSFLDEHGL
jgi:pimeloyl-ACP methyl ester carboxylesterase